MRATIYLDKDSTADVANVGEYGELFPLTHEYDLTPEAKEKLKQFLVEIGYSVEDKP